MIGLLLQTLVGLHLHHQAGARVDSRGFVEVGGHHHHDHHQYGGDDNDDDDDDVVVAGVDGPIKKMPFLRAGENNEHGSGFGGSSGGGGGGGSGAADVHRIVLHHEDHRLDPGDVLAGGAALPRDWVKRAHPLQCVVVVVVVVVVCCCC